MKKSMCRIVKQLSGGLSLGVMLCTLAMTASADDPTPVTGSLLSIHPERPFVPTPLRGQHGGAGLVFDLAGSDQRNLQLAPPLSLRTLSGNSAAPGQRGLVLAGSSLNFELGKRLSLAAGGSVSQSPSSFTALGSIHCENGTLEADSYRASNCHFIDGAVPANSEMLTLGARYRLNDNVRAGLGLFQQEHRINGQPYWAAPVNVAPFNNVMQTGVPGLPGAQMTPGTASSLSGIDMEIEVGFSTDHAGDMIIGLQLTRVLDAQFQNGQAPMVGMNSWNIAEPLDSARLSFDWNQGPFSGGIQSYYQAPVEFLNRSSLDSYAAFDVYFSWRAPWNASVSVGASNVMNAGKKEGTNSDSQLVDPFESIYGRIPYVRYKQDL